MFLKYPRYLLVLSCVLLTVGADTLPIFTVRRRQGTGADALMLAETLFGPDGYNLTLSDERYIVISCNGHKRVEYDTVSGGIWATDNSNLWSPTDGGPPKDIPREDEAIELATKLLARLKMLPTGGSSVVIKKAASSGTFIAHEYQVRPGNYVRDEYMIDMTVSIGISLLAGSGSGPRYEVPLTGGGGKFQVTYGSCKKLIAFQALWREVVGEKAYEVISKEEADNEFQESVSGVVNFTSTLAYLSGPFGSGQKSMGPVYVYRGEARARWTGKAKRSPVQLTPQAVPRDQGEDKEGQLMSRSHEDQAHAEFEAAVEWLGDPYGLPLARKNAAGFGDGVMETSPIGNLTYAKSDKGVWESDFSGQYVGHTRQADMIFYIGHANKDGWLANDPGTGDERIVKHTSFSTTTTTATRRRGTEWLIIAGCGPHQDELFEVGAGNVFERWRGIFDDGLRIMLGYGSESFDSADEGARFMMYAREGYPLIDAWFRAAKDVQPSGVIVSAMWANNARYDHLPGYGHISSGEYSWREERWIM